MRTFSFSDCSPAFVSFFLHLPSVRPVWLDERDITDPACHMTGPETRRFDEVLRQVMFGDSLRKKGLI